MTEPSRIRVMAVDDHEILRMGIKFLLLAFDDIELVGEAYSGEEALRLCGQIQPDVVLMDMVMPGMGGAATIRVIRERYPQVQVVVLTSFQEEELVQKAMRAGAIAYLLKGVPIDELAEAIRAAYAGRPTLSPEAAQALIQATKPSSQPGYDLTRRQQEVLALVVEGLGNLEIAQRLGLSPSTVRYHVSEILAKLGAANRAEAAALAMQYGLVERLDSRLSKS